MTRFAPYTDERLAAMRARDARRCGVCDHKNVTHGSLNSRGVFVGLGMAGCGIQGCDCQQFAETPTT